MTSFTWGHGLFHFTRMPFGLKSPRRRFNALWTSYSLRVRWQFAPFFGRYLNVFKNAGRTHRSYPPSNHVIKRRIRDAEFEEMHFLHKQPWLSLQRYSSTSMALWRVDTENSRNTRALTPGHLDVTSIISWLLYHFRQFVLIFAQVAGSWKKKLGNGQQQTFD